MHYMHSFEGNYQVLKKNVDIFHTSLTNDSFPNQNAYKCVVFLFVSQERQSWPGRGYLSCRPCSYNCM